MRALVLFAGLLLIIAPSTARAEKVVFFEYECTSGLLQASLGQAFNVSIVPHDDDTVVSVEAEIIRPQTPGPFGNPALTLAAATGPATADLPFQLNTGLTTDVAVKGYARAEVLLAGPGCGDGLSGLICLLFRLQPPVVGVFRTSSESSVAQGTTAAITMDCRFDGIDEEL